MNKINYEFINPKNAYQKVFVFPVHNTLKDNIPIYEATRRAWKSSKWFLKEPPGIAVGIKSKISKGVFEIQSWHLLNEEKNKWEFDGNEIDDLLNFDWSKIIDKASGFWQRGNYLGVEFDGKSNFRFFCGNKNKQTWYSLL